MPTLNYFPVLSLLLALGLSQSLLCQEPLPAYLYPVHPNCLDSTGTAVQQKQCTEATLHAFFQQHVDWSKTEMVKKMPKWDMYRDRVRPKKSIVDLPIRIKVE